jgi:hypothetical protein
MSELERNEIRAILQQVADEAKTMSRDEAMQKLVDEGYYTADGHLAARYGGKAEKIA